ncbi:MAG: hypothetical protein GY810_23995 [Aureispira sp.]|nr:hypothetical protein [Aureispira sp.]
MKTLSLSFLLSLMLAVFFISCGETTPTDSAPDTTHETPKTPEEPEETPPPAPEENTAGTTIKAKYKSFEFGDAAYYEFETEAGESITFNRIDDRSLSFHLDLPEAEITDENQGIGANKELLGKWFTITYETKQEPTYTDGPVGDVLVATKIVAAE